jgi:hypothetical protein
MSGLGLTTFAHFAPFQCAIKGAKGCVASEKFPTAHASDRESALTPSRAPPVPGGGTGLFENGAQSADARNRTLPAYRQPGGAAAGSAAADGAVPAVPADAAASGLGRAVSTLTPSVKAPAIDAPIRSPGIPFSFQRPSAS